MRIYIGHSRECDFVKELYTPLKNSSLAKNHELVFPHYKSEKPFSSLNFLKTCDLMIAEVSFPSTGLGIELGWADILKVPIVFIYKSSSRISGSLKAMSEKFIEYSSKEDLVEKLEKEINVV